MWECVQRDAAEFRANGWRLVVSPTAGGIDLRVARDGMATATARLWLPQTSLAPCRERFIRGDELHLSLSDSSTEPLGLDFVLTAIEADQDRLILESVVSLTTSLLDTHPAVELQLGESGPGDPHWGAASWVASNEIASAAYLKARSSQSTGSSVVSTCLLCDDRDRVSLDTEALNDRGIVSFFGDFLEKGVIRKVQPWWLWSRGPLPERAVAKIAEQLARRPLPLTN